MALNETRTALLAAAAAGLLVWIIIVLATGRTEAWDHFSYWGLGFPILMLTSAVLGWLYPEKAWRIGVTASMVQVIPLVIGARSLALFPVGIILLVIIALPLSLAAFLAARARIRHDLRAIAREARRAKEGGGEPGR